MFLIGAVKLIEKKFKTCFSFSRLLRGGELRMYKIKTALFLYHLRCRFTGGNKNITQMKREKYITYFISLLSFHATKNLD